MLLPGGYTVDTVIPITNVHRADYWVRTVTRHGAGSAAGLDWVLATLLVAGYTGLARGD